MFTIGGVSVSGICKTLLNVFPSKITSVPRLSAVDRDAVH